MLVINQKVNIEDEYNNTDDNSYNYKSEIEIAHCSRALDSNSKPVRNRIEEIEEEQKEKKKKNNLASFLVRFRKFEMELRGSGSSRGKNGEMGK